ncbi:MAG TPA: hypothetical protein DCX67_05120, partial [Opitutae bacterium]|nr:hypothetical protein [Opitutae bacterium]
MRISIRRILAGKAIALFAIQILCQQTAMAEEETQKTKALADRVRGNVNSQPLRFPNQHWVRGAYYAGLMAMYESTSDRA